MQTRSLIRSMSCALALGLATAALSGSVLAQGYPSQPLKMIVPFPPGGGGDALARIIAPKIGESLKQSVVIENKPGASGVIATDFVIKAPADGHTILLHSMPIVMTPALFEKPPYDVVRDLTPLVELIYTPLWFAVSTQRSPARSVKEFIDQVRAEPKKHHYASISPGSTGHLLGFQFNETTKLDMEHVGYKGAAPATTALLAGDISGVFLDYSTLKPHVPTGKVRVLAVTGTGRSSQNAEVPTFKELGFNGFEGTSWAGLFVPKATPIPIVQQLSNTVNELLKQPDVIKRYGDLGYEIGIKSQAAFAAQVQTDRDHWSAVLRKTGVKAQ
jgi:tripartite-type tricarboxylate transporter receptor subunit TctC